MEDPNTAVRHEPCPASESLCDLPVHATVQAVLSAGPSGASDWVGLQDIYVFAREIFDLCNARDPGGGWVTTLWTAEPLMRLLGVWRSAVFRWKPGLRIVAASYSGSSRRKISGVAPAPVSVCCSHSEYVCCSRGVTVPRSDCVIKLLLLHKQLDSEPYDRMMEFVGGWCLALTLHAGG